MIMRQDYPKDERVNVIGAVRNGYIPLTDLIRRGSKSYSQNNRSNSEQQFCFRQNVNACKIGL